MEKPRLMPLLIQAQCRTSGSFKAPQRRGKPSIQRPRKSRWVSVPEDLALPDNQQDRDMIARELLIKFQMSERHPMVQLNKAYRKF